VNSKEKNSSDFCPNYVQEFSLSTVLVETLLHHTQKNGLIFLALTLEFAYSNKEILSKNRHSSKRTSYFLFTQNKNGLTAVCVADALYVIIRAIFLYDVRVFHE
jgi:hypothetical protein